jgi:hypothetical protein
MNKLKLAIIIILILGTTGLFLHWRKVHKENRAAIMAQSTAIARELVTQRHSPHLLFPGHLFQQRMARFLAVPAQVEAVRYGDESHPAGAERAASRIYLVNKRGTRLALRISPEGDLKHFRLLGWSVPTAPPPAS